MQGIFEDLTFCSIQRSDADDLVLSPTGRLHTSVHATESCEYLELIFLGNVVNAIHRIRIHKSAVLTSIFNQGDYFGTFQLKSHHYVAIPP